MPVSVITCPHCRRSLEVDQQQRGSRLRCPFPDCRKLFRWREDGTCVPDQPQSASVVAATVMYRDWRSAPPPRRIFLAPSPSSQESPVPVSEPEASLEDLVALGFSPEQLRASSSANWWTALFFLGLLAITGLVAWMVFRAEKTREPHLAAEAEQLFREREYSQALNKYRDLLRQFPGSSRRAEYGFYEQACLLQAWLSNPKVEAHRVTGLATQFLRQYRQAQQFRLYQRELAEAIYKVARRAAEEARKSLDRLLLEQVKELYAALQEIGFGLGDPGARNQELSDLLAQADYAVRLAEARSRMQLAIQAALHLQRPTLVEEAHKLFEQLGREFTEVSTDADTLKQLAKLLEEESSWLGHFHWVGYQAALDWSLAAEGVPTAPVAAIASGLFPSVPDAWSSEVTTEAGGQKEKTATKTANADRPENEPVVLADGATVLAFSNTTGRLRWTARMVGEKNLRVLSRDPYHGRVFIWAGDRRMLSAIEPSQPRVLWTVQMPGTAPAVPTVMPPYWWLADPRGWIWYGDTETGQVLGAFWLDFSLHPEIRVNPVNGVAFVATEKKRVFLMDAAKRQARVLITGHQTGRVACAPLPLVSGVLLPLVHQQIVLLGVSMGGSVSGRSAPPSSLLQWPGQRLVDVVCTGEFAVLVSDRHEVVLVQAARDSATAGRILGASKWSLSLPPPARSSPVVILGERLGDWWLASSAGLVRLHWDDYREQLQQELFPIPAGELRDFAWDARFPGRLVVLLREPDNSWRIVCWNITTAAVVWQTTAPARAARQ